MKEILLGSLISGIASALVAWFLQFLLPEMQKPAIDKESGTREEVEKKSDNNVRIKLLIEVVIDILRSRPK